MDWRRQILRWSCTGGPLNNEGHPDPSLVHKSFCTPKASRRSPRKARAMLRAIVARQDEEGVVPQPRGLQTQKQAPKGVVHLGHAAVVHPCWPALASG
eukprot:scaffold262615_cov27-Tisochrysis_lutea.AAC.3